MSSGEAGSVPPALLALLELHHEARRAEAPDALRYLCVNRTRGLVAYRQAALLTLTSGGRRRLEAVSNLSEVSRDAPFTRWLEAAARGIDAEPDVDKVHPIDRAALPATVEGDWAEWSAAHAVWCPLPAPGAAPGDRPPAVLWLAREESWTDGELVLLDRLGEGYGHAWWALNGGRRPTGGFRRRLFGALIAAGIAGGAAWPVPLSAVAPAEVTADNPMIVAAPIDGVIERFMIRPNEPVREGQPLFRFDETTPRGRYEVAQRTLTAARAELMTAGQGAFADPQSKAKLAQLKAQVDLREAEANYARDLLDRVVVRAERSGVAVFADENDWLGRPVSVGERVMALADPERVRVEIRVPVGDAVAMDVGARVRLFLNVDPLHPVRARVTRSAYEPTPSAAGVLSFRVFAEIDPGETPPRLGLRGTARIEGEPVPLGLLLFRRPLAAARQTIGF